MTTIAVVATPEWIIAPKWIIVSVSIR